MVAKPVTGHSVFSRALLAPGDVGIGTHSARGRHSTCAMAPKPMEYEITDGRRGDETLAQQPPRESSRVRRPPYRNSGYKPSDDAKTGAELLFELVSQRLRARGGPHHLESSL